MAATLTVCLPYRWLAASGAPLKTAISISLLPANVKVATAAMKIACLTVRPVQNVFSLKHGGAHTCGLTTLTLKVVILNP
eukprot:5431818-Amphidinium_carterae.1